MPTTPVIAIATRAGIDCWARAAEGRLRTIHGARRT
jgi:hypothetical protein